MTAATGTYATNAAQQVANAAATGSGARPRPGGGRRCPGISTVSRRSGSIRTVTRSAGLIRTVVRSAGATGAAGRTVIVSRAAR